MTSAANREFDAKKDAFWAKSANLEACESRMIGFGSSFEACGSPAVLQSPTASQMQT